MAEERDPRLGVKLYHCGDQPDDRAGRSHELIKLALYNLPSERLLQDLLKVYEEYHRKISKPASTAARAMAVREFEECFDRLGFEHHQPPWTQKTFDRRRDRSRGEIAILRALLLEPAMDHDYLLASIFQVTRRAAWTLEPEMDLSARGTSCFDESIKPSLCISFNKDAIGGDNWAYFSYKVPWRVIQPSKSSGFFPFFFCEAVDDDFDHSMLRNRRSAAQALWNLHHVMDQADMNNADFEEVFFFSITLSTERVVLMVHCAVWDEDRGNLSYRWEVRESHRHYNHETLYRTVRQYVHAPYITECLLPMMKKSFQLVCDQAEKEHRI